MKSDTILSRIGKKAITIEFPVRFAVPVGCRGEPQPCQREDAVPRLSLYPLHHSQRVRRETCLHWRHVWGRYDRYQGVSSRQEQHQANMGANSQTCLNFRELRLPWSTTHGFFSDIIGYNSPPKMGVKLTCGLSDAFPHCHAELDAPSWRLCAPATTYIVIAIFFSHSRNATLALPRAHRAAEGGERACNFQ